MDGPDFYDNYNLTDADTSFTAAPDLSSMDSLALSPVAWAALALFSLVFLVGVLGNGAVVWVVGFQMRHTVNTVWFLNLSMADLLCCLTLPFLAIPLARNQHWPLGGFACKLLPSVIILNMFASILLLTAISTDRCALVMRPVWCQNHRSAPLAWGLCGGAWGLAFLLTLPSFLIRQLNVDRFSEKVSCVVDYSAWGGRTLELSLAISRFLLGFLVPLAIISLCYGLLLLRLHRSHALRSRKTLTVVLVVVLGFFVCWTPYHVTGLILAKETPNSTLFISLSQAEPLIVALAYVNSCINPVIYVIAGQGFQTKMCRSLKAVLRNIMSEEALQPSVRAECHTRATGLSTMAEDRSTSTTV
ncbi:C5a anaphylatoxin chemotactic receptor 1 [Tiliqua scincoides]|uniref:C5a anaphylatoxin chemotactic receptor 1 n=1 Tax=Tiliqua scincoides TaxID=71010 RepID=UPI003462A93B